MTTCFLTNNHWSLWIYALNKCGETGGFDHETWNHQQIGISIIEKGEVHHLLSGMLKFQAKHTCFPVMRCPQKCPYKTTSHPWHVRVDVNYSKLLGLSHSWKFSSCPVKPTTLSENYSMKTNNGGYLLLWALICFQSQTYQVFAVKSPMWVLTTFHLALKTLDAPCSCTCRWFGFVWK